ncbi:MAG: chemotaxis-specific protein-glutamate methyltransferase CheB [Planctomycetes bacterium]|nr:chemotaxis-specific protein-glutamate methyltransferase CheB [Planctomycetota bacterium]
MKRDGPIKVLVVDDSPTFRSMLTRALNDHADIRVAAAASDAFEARDCVLQHHPDVIVLDLEMPRVSGLEFLARLREHYPVPVIICSGTTGRNGPKALQAMALGAFDVVIKPNRGGRAALQSLANELAERIRVADSQGQPVPSPRTPVRREPPSFRAAGLNPARYLVVVGASTGGTEALTALLSHAPADFPSMVMVQHMPVGFTHSFAERLDQHSRMRVSEAVDGDRPTVGAGFLARGDAHLTVRRIGAMLALRYTDSEPVNRHCPSVDVLFDSAREAVGGRAIGVLLTGMGADGAQGLLRLRQQGALTIAQSRDSCVVYGMPKVATEIGGVDFSSSPSEMPELILREVLARSGKNTAAGGERRLRETR